MASKKKSDGIVRGAALVKKAIEAAKASGIIGEPEPVPASALKKLRLPNDEKISPAMKELLAFDATFLGWEIDEEEPELEPMSLDEFVEQEFGEDFVKQFGEAIEMLGDDCLPIGEGGDRKRFLYIGSPDEKGEYPVITLTTDDGCSVHGFVPFDIWIAQQFGIIEAETTPGSVPPEYEASCKALAEANGDGRVSFKAESRDLERDGDEEGDEDEGDDEDDFDEDEDEDDVEDDEAEPKDKG